MSAKLIYETSPLGSLIRYSNGQPRPPERHSRKLKAWNNDNGMGRLVERAPGRVGATYSSPPTFTLHLGNYGSHGAILMVVRRVYTIDSALQFYVADTPRPGMVRLLTPIGDHEELQHLAPDMEAAKAWMARHHYHNIRAEIVPYPDPVVRSQAIGRAA